MADYNFNNNALDRLHEAVKDAIDPNGILSARRYDIGQAFASKPLNRHGCERVRSKRLLTPHRIEVQLLRRTVVRKSNAARRCSTTCARLATAKIKGMHRERDRFSTNIKVNFRHRLKNAGT
jgi:hypothetical protein